MRVLVACEFSGIVRDAFIAKGHEAWSCDLVQTERPGNHLVGSVLNYIPPAYPWDLMIAHPPCTYLANSGVRWLHTDASRWPKLFEAADLFRALLEADIPRIAVENPVMHKYGRRLIGSGHTQTVQPWQFGDGQVKRTCLWLKNLPPLVPTDIVEGREARVHKMSPGPDRGRLRSITYQGIANAMADQWG